jgi:hypothetical protein
MGAATGITVDLRSLQPEPARTGRNPADVPSVSMVNSHGAGGAPVNISAGPRSSGTKFPDSCEQLTLVGPGTRFRFPACAQRSRPCQRTGRQLTSP